MALQDEYLYAKNSQGGSILWFDLTLDFMERNDTSKIVYCAKQYYRNIPSPKGLNFLGQAHYFVGEYEEAFHCFDSLIQSRSFGRAFYFNGMKIHPGASSCVLYYNRANCYFELDSFELSRTDLTQSLEVEPNNGLAYVALGATEFENANYAEAISLINKGLFFTKTDFEKGLYYRGLSHLELDQTENACKDFSELLYKSNQYEIDGYSPYVLTKKYASLQQKVKQIRDLVSCEAAISQ